MSDIAAEVDRLIRDNPMTPQVALNAITNLVARRQEYLENLQELKRRLEQLGIQGSQIEPGQAEIGILLPRELFQNHLEELIGELRVLNRVIRAFSEVATGAAEPIEVHQISTSDPVFFFGLSATTIAIFGKAVKWALDTWKQVEDIRKVRAEAQRTGAAAYARASGACRCSVQNQNIGVSCSSVSDEQR